MLTPRGPTPYKLGMFQQNGTRSFVGMVIQDDTVVVDLSRANVGAPATLKELVARWDAGIRHRLAALAADAKRGRTRLGYQSVGIEDAAADRRSERDPECRGELSGTRR